MFELNYSSFIYKPICNLPTLIYTHKQTITYIMEVYYYEGKANFLQTSSYLGKNNL